MEGQRCAVSSEAAKGGQGAALAPHVSTRTLACYWASEITAASHTSRPAHGLPSAMAISNCARRAEPHPYPTAVGRYGVRCFTVLYVALRRFTVLCGVYVNCTVHYGALRCLCGVYCGAGSVCRSVRLTVPVRCRHHHTSPEKETSDVDVPVRPPRTGVNTSI